MGIFPLFKKPAFFTAEEQARIVAAIRTAEKETSGEVRFYVESKNPFMDAVDRAKEIFFQFKMEQTDYRNAVLMYIAIKDHELALFGDEGIYNKVGKEYWDNAVKNMIAEFNGDQVVDGIVHCILRIGQTLKETFPYNATTDKNELPDDLIFGK